ncbi:MAG TPA: phage regulatory CII family protein [Geobacteraceae bacterium]
MNKPVTEVSDDIVRELPDMRAALRACVMFSRLKPKAIAYELGLDPSHLSKMINAGDDPRHFPPNKLNLLMQVCGNEIPLRWLLLSRGYPSPRQVNELEAENAQLKAELEVVRNDRRLMVNIFKEVRP